MSRLIYIVIIAAIAAGAYFFLAKPEQTPVEQLQSAAEEAGEAASEAASAAQDAASDALTDATEQAGQAASDLADQATETAQQAGEAASDLADQAGEQVAALAGQGQELFNSWVQDGMLTAEQFDFDKMVASVQDSDLAQGLKDQALAILEEIKASPETIAEKLQELQALLTQQ